MRYMSKSAVKALWSVCTFASGTLEALLIASGFGEKQLKSSLSTEQSVTLWIILC